jgi:hypothetical protein
MVGRQFSAETRARLHAAHLGKKSGANHPKWKGGRALSSYGYVLIHAPDHPRANSRGYVREHILVWEATHGPIPSGFCLHHLNGDKQDNRLENLKAMTNVEHVCLHHRLERLERTGS